MVERPRRFLYRHSPSGRYEEYRAKHDYLLEQTQGEARYFFEKRLDREAKSYARKKVALEVLGTAIAVSGAVFFGYEIKHKRLSSDLQMVGHAVLHPIDTIKNSWNTLLDQSVDHMTNRVVLNLHESMPGIVDAASAELGRKVGEEMRGVELRLGEMLKILRLENILYILTGRGKPNTT